MKQRTTKTMTNEPERLYYLTVTDLKQFAYCPRVVFYERCLPHIRPRTYKMDAGAKEHELEQKRAARRSLTRYGTIEGNRIFDYACRSETLGLKGVIDQIVYTEDGRIIPVDYKMAKAVSRNHRLQLAAYALLLEDESKQQNDKVHDISEGYIYLVPQRKFVLVKLTTKLKQDVRDMLIYTLQMVTAEQMPAPTTVKQRCLACEFRRFCNDID